MKRFYLKRIEDHVTIVHRPTHQVIGFGELNGELKKLIKLYVDMSTEEFYKELNNLGLKLRIDKTNNLEGRTEENEEWYKGAWKFTTEQVLEHYNLDKDIIPEEQPPIELIKKLNRDKTGDWNLEGKKLPKKKKKLTRKPKKMSNKRFSTIEEVREAYLSKEITLKEYKKLKMNLARV